MAEGSAAAPVGWRVSGMVRLGIERLGMAWLGMARLGMARLWDVQQLPMNRLYRGGTTAAAYSGLAA